jgi:cytochrome c-type biogenesis protein CcmH/NrfF
MPAWILWLSPVIVAPLLAVLWITWASRPKGREEARETVQRYDRFRAALQDRSEDERERQHRAS